MDIIGVLSIPTRHFMTANLLDHYWHLDPIQLCFAWAKFYQSKKYLLTMNGKKVSAYYVSK